MNPAPSLQLDDVVESIEDGRRFTISQIFKNEDGSLDYSARGEPLHHASALRKVEELRIGDWVEVIGPSVSGMNDQVGMGHEISKSLMDNRYFELELFGNERAWPASSLRKLTPDEIPHGQTIGEAMQEFSSEVEKAKDAIRDILAPLVDERLSAIEKRLAFVEAFQKGHVEETPCIDDVVSKILDEPALQKGDYVEVQRDGCGKKKGFVFKITYIKTENYPLSGSQTYYSANKLPMRTEDELRKLSDEEISKRLNGEEVNYHPLKEVACRSSSR